MFTGIGLIAFLCISGAGAVGLLLGPLLPESDRAEPTQKIVQAVMNIVAILAALVLGLLVASTKTNFDTRSKEIEQFATSLTLLDRELMHFGQDAKDIRGQLRTFTTRKIALIWPPERGRAPILHDDTAVRMLDDIETDLRTTAPSTEVLQAARADALQLIVDLKRTSRLLGVQQGSEAPRPFLVAVIFWVSMLFLSHGIFARWNLPIVAAMLICALSVSIAVNLIFDMDHPFRGFIRVPSMPMQQALDQMAP